MATLRRTSLAFGLTLLLTACPGINKQERAIDRTPVVDTVMKRQRHEKHLKGEVSTHFESFKAKLTDKDKADLKTAASIDADYLAVSFPRNADDIVQARRMLEAEGSSAGLCAKIERAEALDNLDEIIEASDAIMIARGDLGVEIGDAKLPSIQKEIINKARNLKCVTITATQMMESMI